MPTRVMRRSGSESLRDPQNGDRHGLRAGAFQHGRAADPHLGGARPGRARPPVHGAARGVRPAGVPRRSPSPTSKFRCRRRRSGCGRPRWRRACCRSSELTPGGVGARDRHRQRLPHRAAGEPRRARSRASRSIRGSRRGAARSSPARASPASRSRRRRRRARLGHASLRRDRADRLDADAARCLRRAAEARRAASSRSSASAPAMIGAARALGRARARVTEQDLFETVIEPLRNAASPSRFGF